MKRAIVLILTLLMVFASLSVYASELNDKMSELEKIQKQLEQTENKLKQVKQQEKTVLEELKDIEDDLVEAQSELETLESMLTQVKKDIVVVEKDLVIAEGNVSTRNELLGRRVRAIQENGTVSYLEVLLSSTSFSDFVNRYELLQQIIRSDVVILEQVREEKALIEEKKALLLAKRTEVARLTRDAEVQKRRIEERASSREQKLEELQNDKIAYEKALDDLEKTSKQLEKTIRDLQAKNKGNAPATGSYIWPVNGRVTSPFGNRYHPILKTWKLHTGIDIGASSGTPVKAANSGIVISAGWMGSYGYTVIIDHGGGISTLYAHHSSLLVKSGDSVLRGDVIARVGSTGLSTGPHLHFEVRVKGVPNDPMKWLP
jgi:murein DD-endopeptidase MepM/ murein hydrolase activator NlpD